MTTETSRHLICLRDGRSDLAPLFLLHPLSGLVQRYVEVAARIEDEGRRKKRAVVGVVARGLNGEREPLDRVEALGVLAAQAIRARQPDGPYHLAGWSFGGLVALEAALALRGRGLEVRTLTVMDNRALDAAGSAGRAALDEDRAARLFAADLSRAGGAAGALKVPAAGSGRPRLRERALQIWTAARAAGLSPGSPEAVEDRLRVYLAHAAALKHYAPRPYPGRLLFIAAGDDRAHEGEQPVEDQEPSRGWCQVSDGITVERAAGDHDSMLEAPHAARTAALLQAHIAGADAR